MLCPELGWGNERRQPGHCPLPVLAKVSILGADTFCNSCIDMFSQGFLTTSLIGMDFKMLEAKSFSLLFSHEHCEMPSHSECAQSGPCWHSLGPERDGDSPEEAQHASGCLLGCPQGAKFSPEALTETTLRSFHLSLETPTKALPVPASPPLPGTTLCGLCSPSQAPLSVQLQEAWQVGKGVWANLEQEKPGLCMGASASRSQEA